MKKTIIILTALFCTIAGHAQAPFTIYRPAQTPSRSYSLPTLPDPFGDLEADMAAQAYSQQIVSSETMTVNGLELYSESYSPMKVKIVQRRNGQVEITCLGIKKNGYWKTCDKGIASLESMYNQAKTESDKSTILSLMEYGNYLLIVDPDREIYVIE